MSAIDTRKTSRDTEDQLHSSLTRVFADLMRAYLECSDEVQDSIREMTRIVNDPDADPDEREMALLTIREALFPQHHNGILGADIGELESNGLGAPAERSAIVSELDAEEAQFAERVQALMQARGMTQFELASESGVGQSAVSMMLSRNCRPQRRTVTRIAKALKVSAEELWPFD